ncbi:MULTISPECIES: head maturation protease, ClpP-related [unclassified Massilia]|uniref:head maturation protease, ClpP-related n=1 Tax=unclassified Massilia TaxID=2609279 RepID=UPI00177D4938|nr:MULTISPECIES: head maturation protease, ClpP-related [unclassified Massilia]MBD8531564.1 Clp protease ClpP [Massilia sp. CFBP 13647]MBD8673640.1 Clp protease ClpP [Massilia sp. CFBP 13721]
MNPFFQLCLDNAATAIVAGKRAVLVTNSAGQTIFVRGVIAPGYEANAADIVAAIDQADPTKDLHFHFNTPGGSVFEGKEIAAAIRNFPGRTIANIVSMCASAGTSIAVACSEVVMQKGAFFMIHNAQGAAFGDKTALRDTADLMEKVELSIVDDYTTKTGKPAEEVIAMMEAETWMTAAEALEHGFIDSIAGEGGVSNAWNLSAYSRAPAVLAAAPAPVEPAVTPAAPAVATPNAEVALVPVAAPAPIANSMAQANRNRLALIQATS